MDEGFLYTLNFYTSQVMGLKGLFIISYSIMTKWWIPKSYQVVNVKILFEISTTIMAKLWVYNGKAVDLEILFVVSNSRMAP